MVIFNQVYNYIYLGKGFFQISDHLSAIVAELVNQDIYARIVLLFSNLA